MELHVAILYRECDSLIKVGRNLADKQKKKSSITNKRAKLQLFAYIYVFSQPHLPNNSSEV